MFVELLPEAFGLVVTPLAVVGVILLLESARPIANAVAFGAAFALISALLAVAVFAGGVAAGDGPPSAEHTRFAGVVGVVIGALFVIGGLVSWLRPRSADQGEPRWVRRLETADPRGAFLAGLGLAVLNPNVVILLSGMTIVVAADVSTAARIGGAVFLVAASLLDIAVPAALYIGFGQRAKRVLGSIKRWTVAHTRAITVVMLLVLGVVFLTRGVAKL